LIKWGDPIKNIWGVGRKDSEKEVPYRFLMIPKD
jgi:hypothetical protein